MRTPLAIVNPIKVIDRGGHVLTMADEERDVVLDAAPSIHLIDRQDVLKDTSVIANCGILLERFELISVRFDDGRLCDTCLDRHRRYAQEGLGLNKCFALFIRSES